jgi:hypothetical protein
MERKKMTDLCLLNSEPKRMFSYVIEEREEVKTRTEEEKRARDRGREEQRQKKKKKIL